MNEFLWFPGWLKLLYPPYFIMALRFAFLFKSKKYRYLPIGPHAAKDMALICNIFFPFRFKKIKEIRQSFIPWGDFVEKSKYDYFAQNKTPELKVLYIGRLLKLKHIDDIIRAVKLLSNVKLLIVGNGPDEIRLKKIANNQISFHNAVSLDQVREVMRAHDVVVFASNAFDGWGAVVQEALSERVPVFGTYEAGASAAILPESQLFHCGDYKTLSEMLYKFQKNKENTNTNLPSDTYLSTLPSDYTPDGAAKRLLNIIKKM